MEILFFTSKSCMACKHLLPRLEGITDIKINVIDVEENSKIASEYGICSLPTLLYMVNGKPQRQITGSVSDKTLREWLNNEIE